ncbi:hypothetical protein [Mycobacterium sp. 94-17]|uniref:hypothetical protein n=1 Tax=Mycobacterium sp. 94-17 TaxID=2986147 RepID=UPI002D1F6630|nr:hypothetical protein [Mycobacterium sp. 94-17]MEB4209881.1 hypothetical protein [Mycobacterium sp. 94-17]
MRSRLALSTNARDKLVDILAAVLIMIIVVCVIVIHTTWRCGVRSGDLTDYRSITAAGLNGAG